MNDDYYYYKQRCQELENELMVVTKTMRNLEKNLHDIKMSVDSMLTNSDE